MFIEIADFKDITTLVRERLGNKFAIAYFDEDGLKLYISSGLSDMEKCYIADAVNEERREK